MDILLQISAFAYTLLTTIVFLSKKKVNKIENFVYKGILALTYIELFFDIGYHVLYYFMPNSMISEAFARLFLCSSVSWSLGFTSYIFVLSSPKNTGGVMTKDMKKYFVDAFLIVVGFILIVDAIIFFLPLYPDPQPSHVLLDGLALYFVYGVIGSTTFINLFLILKNNQNIFAKKYASVWVLSFLLVVGLIIQITYPIISVNITIAAFTTMLIFFTLENPDLELIEDLNIATRQAEQANHAKSDFLSNMSHEIRTPLNAIIGFSQALAKEDISGSAKDEVKDILIASNNLLEIVNGILDISKIEANKIEIVNIHYSTRELMNDICTLINTRIGSKPIEFRIDVDDKLPPVLYGDPMRINQVITNLLTNSVKYTKEGYILFDVKFETEENKCKLIIKVEDTGIGMTEQDLEHLYTKFQRFDLDKNINIAGTGLGMAITKGLVDLMGGEIQVKSTYGEGTTFTVYLDQEISTKKLEEVEVKEDLGNITPFNATGQKVLVVDDNKINLKVAERLLQEYNLSVELVGSGAECIDKILAGNTYDLIFLDIMMPKMKGPEVLQNLKNIVGFNTPVVALTADVISGMEDKYTSQGFDDCMPKPIVEEELFYVLKKFLTESESSKVAELTLTKKDYDITILEEANVNVKQGLELLNSQELYDSTIERFFKELDEKMAQLYEYKKNADMSNYNILITSLKKESRYLGLNDFGDIAYEHEIASKQQNVEFISKNFPKLKMESIRIYDLLQKYLGR